MRRRARQPHGKAVAGGAAAWLLLAGLPAFAAQAGPSGPSSSFSEEISVELVTIDVRVQDHKGRPVDGLGRSDFKLSIDGQPVEITNFSAPTPAAERRAAPAVHETAGEPSSQPASPAAGRNFVLFVDDAHLDPGSRRQSLADLKTFVQNRLAPDDRVMLAVYDGSLRIEEPFTIDRQRIADRLDALAGEAGPGIHRRTELRSTLQRLRSELDSGRNQSAKQGTCAADKFYGAEAIIREYAGSVTGEVEGSVGAVERLTAALAGLPGGTELLYVSDGLELRPGIDLWFWLSEACSNFQQEVAQEYYGHDMTKALLDLTSRANANRVTLYTLDAGGLGSDVSADLGPGLKVPVSSLRARTANLQHTLFLLANETGGEAVFNTNRFDQALQEVDEDTDHVYSLGFRPPEGVRGTKHLIKVEVAGRGLQARYPTSYLDKTAEERVGERMLATLLFGGGSNRLGIEAELEPAKPIARSGKAAKGEEKVEVPVRIRIPIENLTLVPKAPSSAALEGKVRLVLAALDSSGRWTEIRQKTVQVESGTEGESEPAAGTDTGGGQAGNASPDRVVEVTMELLPGDVEVAVGVHDMIGDRVSFLRIKGRVGIREVP